MIPLALLAYAVGVLSGMLVMVLWAIYVAAHPIRRR